MKRRYHDCEIESSDDLQEHVVLRDGAEIYRTTASLADAVYFARHGKPEPIEDVKPAEPDEPLEEVALDDNLKPIGDRSPREKT